MERYCFQNTLLRNESSVDSPVKAAYNKSLN